MRYYIYCNEKKLNTNIQKAIDEFEKRLSAYCETQMIVSNILSFPKDLKENNHCFVYISKSNSTFTSIEFANYIDSVSQSGKSNLHVIIGFEEYTVYEALSALSVVPENISLTKTALSNETLSLMFLEQLYRGYTILQGKTYHK